MADPQRIVMTPQDVSDFLDCKELEPELALCEALEGAAIAVSKGEPDQEIVIVVKRSM